jgi:hypothetical protein
VGGQPEAPPVRVNPSLSGCYFHFLVCCADTRYSCVALKWMIERLLEMVPSGVALFTLDACRENPTDSTFRAKGASGARARGGLCVEVRPPGTRRDRCVWCLE